MFNIMQVSHIQKQALLSGAAGQLSLLPHIFPWFA